MPRGKTHQNRKHQKRHAAAKRGGTVYKPNGVTPQTAKSFGIGEIPNHRQVSISNTTTNSQSPNDYNSLPFAADTDGECYRCGRFPNSTMTERTPAGPKQVIICSGCNARMQPKTLRTCG